jgi:hypothetical protein
MRCCQSLPLALAVAAAVIAGGCSRTNASDQPANAPHTSARPAVTDAMTDMEMAGMGHPATSGDDDSLGLTLMGLTPSYLIVLNIVGPEQMFTPEQAASLNPTDGELILKGSMAHIKADSRHTEVHIYSRRTGLPLTDTVPAMTITDRDSGTTVRPEQTLMQDVTIGSRDIHFGNNAVIARDHDFRVRVTIGSEEVDFHGRLL